MKNPKLFALIGLMTVAPVTSAEDASANFLTKLFTNVCIPNVGQPDKVRAWATEKNLPEVTSEPALNVFVGPGNKGIAWAVPSAYGSFALSLRAKTKACAVWARAANPTDVEKYFSEILEGASRPGVNVTIVKDSHDTTSGGNVHTLIYSVTASEARNSGLLYTMQVSKNSGGAFQATLQAARFNEP